MTVNYHHGINNPEAKRHTVPMLGTAISGKDNNAPMVSFVYRMRD